jgi:uncharacterized protein
MLRKGKTVRNFLLFIIALPLFLVIFLSVPILLREFNINFLNYNHILNNKSLQGFTTIFISIILEALPFIILGTFISSLIQIFISEDTISRLIPKNRFVGVLCAALIGLIFPVCDCAIVPIVRRLLKKGVPLHIGITFMLSVPILNPIVLSSTYYAFSNNLSMLFLRGFLGFISAMIIGSLMGIFEGTNKVLKEFDSHDNHIHTHSHIHANDNCSCGHDHTHSHSTKVANPVSLIIDVLEHTNIELHDVGRFLIFGAFLSSLMQTFLPRKYILFVGQDNLYSVFAMIVLAFLLAICSETDAFIARTFVGQFTTGSIVAFLIFGPMMDIKNTLMLSSTFKARFVITLIFIIFTVCFIIGISINLIEYKGGLQWLNLIKVN